jgi:hypothetical protein
MPFPEDDPPEMRAFLDAIYAAPTSCVANDRQ